MPNRHTMTPVEFDAACRELLSQCEYLSETSGTRSEERNAAVGGNPESKHLYGIARDFVANDSAQYYSAAGATARDLGLWFVVHDKGSGDHLHVQGAAPGPIEDWWLEKYWRVDQLGGERG